LKISRFVNDAAFAAEMVAWLYELGVLTLLNIASNVVLVVATVRAKCAIII
jgi:hypothetical protein